MWYVQELLAAFLDLFSTTAIFFQSKATLELSYFDTLKLIRTNESKHLREKKLRMRERKNEIGRGKKI